MGPSLPSSGLTLGTSIGGSRSTSNDRATRLRAEKDGCCTCDRVVPVPTGVVRCSGGVDWEVPGRDPDGEASSEPLGL